MMLYKNTKVKVRSSDGDTDFFNIAADVLQGDTLVPYLFIICLDLILRMLIDLTKEDGFTLENQEADDTTHELIYMYIYNWWTANNECDWLNAYLEYPWCSTQKIHISMNYPILLN